MGIKLILSLIMMSMLHGCSKPPDLNAPCTHFGKYCPQYPINEEPIHEVMK